MNVLIVSDFKLYPFTTGASIAQIGVMQPWSKKCNISLVIPENFTLTDKELGEFQKYKNHPSQVKFMGYVDDLYSFTKNSISIAPIRIGGGLRAKIMLAMAQGIPVISTTHGLSGISAKHTESVMIADDTNCFCSAVEYLLFDLDRTFTICKNAQELMRTEYSQSFISEKRYSLYKDLLSRSNEG